MQRSAIVPPNPTQYRPLKDISLVWRLLQSMGIAWVNNLSPVLVWSLLLRSHGRTIPAQHSLGSRLPYPLSILCPCLACAMCIFLFSQFGSVVFGWKDRLASWKLMSTHSTVNPHLWNKVNNLNPMSVVLSKYKHCSIFQTIWFAGNIMEATGAKDYRKECK